MEDTTVPALLMEALSDKVLHQLPAAVWKGLFLGEGRDSIVFEQRHLTLVHADAVVQPDGSDAWERFFGELQQLAVRYGGRLDPYVDAAALIFFEDAGAAVRMGLALQRAGKGLGMRVGVVSGPCTLAYFRAQDRLWCTPLGVQPARAAEVAMGAQLGGIVISPETYSSSDKAATNPTTSEFKDSESDLSALQFALDEQPATYTGRWR